MSYKMCSVSRVQIVIYFFAALFMTLHFSSCDLFVDDEHCEYSKDVVKNWYTGNPVEAIVDVEPEEDVLWIFAANLGDNGMLIRVDDLCNSETAIVSAELETTIYLPGFKPTVEISYIDEINGYKYRRTRVGMAPSTLNATKFVLDPIEIPVWPDFSSEVLSSSIIGLTISFNVLDYKEREEINSYCESLANAAIKDAKITLSYTQY
ncbi:MAG: hypothetical protein HKN67_14520 [Saprospiraceae bacterium]|nr:hypothetical protein [Bacteroidia bacterium]NNF23151.1 hypothetical protein [Saprospiraceae bacterium]